MVSFLLLFQSLYDGDVMDMVIIKRSKGLIPSEMKLMGCLTSIAKVPA